MDPSWSEDDDYPSRISYRNSQQQYKPRQYTASRTGGMRRDRNRERLQQEAIIRALKPASKRSSRNEEPSIAHNRQLSLPPLHSKGRSVRQRSPHPHFDVYLDRDISVSPFRSPEYPISSHRDERSSIRPRSLTSEPSPHRSRARSPERYTYFSRQSRAYSPDRHTSLHSCTLDSHHILPISNRYDETPTRHSIRPTISIFTPREHTIEKSTPQGLQASNFLTPREIPGYPTPRETPASKHQLQRRQARTLDRGRSNSILDDRATQSSRAHAPCKCGSSNLPFLPQSAPVNRYRCRNSSPLRRGTSRTGTNFNAKLKVAHSRKTNYSRSRGRSPNRSVSPEPTLANERRGRNVAARLQPSKDTIDFSLELKAAYAKQAEARKARRRSSTPPFSRESSAVSETRDRDLSPIPSASRPRNPRRSTTRNSTPKPKLYIPQNFHRPRGRSPTRRPPIQFPLPAIPWRKALNEGEHQGNSPTARDLSEQNDASPTFPFSTTTAANICSAQLISSNSQETFSDTLLANPNSQQHQPLSLSPTCSAERSPPQIVACDDNEQHFERSSSAEPEKPIQKSVPLKHRFTPQLPAPKAVKSTTPTSRKRRFDSIATPSSTRQPKSKAKTPANPKTKPASRTPSSRKRVKSAKDPTVATSSQLPSTPLPEHQRQLTAAATIIARETAGKDILLFGEIVETDLERDKRVTAEQFGLETVRLAKEAKEKQTAEKAEAKAVRERKKLRIAAEKSELLRLKKETTEVKKKIQRERARKKEEANRQKELELKRQITLHKLENERVIAKMNELLKETAQRVRDEQLRSAQGARDLLKKNQEQKRMQAMGLSAARVSDPPKEDESSMFLPGGRSLSQMGSGPLASAVARGQATLNFSIKTFDVVRESLERKKEEERLADIKKREQDKLKAKGEQMKARDRIKQSRKKIKDNLAKAEAPKTPPKTPKAPKAKPVEKCKNTAFAPEESDTEFDDDDVEMGNSNKDIAATTFPPTPESDDDDNHSIRYDEAPSSPCSAPRKTAKATKAKAPRKVNTDKLAKAKAARKVDADEPSEAKQRQDNIAREKARVKIQKEVETSGLPLTDGEMERRLEHFMEKRKEESKKRSDRRLKNKAKENALGDTPVQPDDNAISQDPFTTSDAILQNPFTTPATIPQVPFSTVARSEDEVDLNKVADESERLGLIAKRPNATYQQRLDAYEAHKRKMIAEQEDQSRESPFPYVTHDSIPDPYLNPAYIRVCEQREAKRKRSIERGTDYSKKAEIPYVFEYLTDSDDSAEDSDDETPPFPVSSEKRTGAADDMDMTFEEILNNAVDEEMSVSASLAEMAGLEEGQNVTIIYSVVRISQSICGDDSSETEAKTVNNSRTLVNPQKYYVHLSEAISAGYDYTVELLKPHSGVPDEHHKAHENKVEPLLKAARDHFLGWHKPWAIKLDLKKEGIWWLDHLGDTIIVQTSEFKLNDQGDFEEDEEAILTDRSWNLEASYESEKVEEVEVHDQLMQSIEVEEGYESEEVDMEELLNDCYEVRSQNTNEHQCEDGGMYDNEDESEEE